MTEYTWMNTGFIYWLDQQLKERNLSQADLARLAKLERGTISNLLNGKKSPGFDACKSIAKGLRLPPELVLIKAGLLEEKTKLNTTLEEAMHLFQQIPEEYQQTLIDLMRVVAEKKEKYQTK